MTETKEQYRIKNDYHDSPSLSSSQIACFLQDPIEWYHVYKLKDWPRKQPTPAMEFGTLIHTLMEVGIGRLDVAVKPDGMSFATKEGKCWKASHDGMQIVSSDDYSILQTIWNNAQRNQFVKAAIETGETESEIFWNDPDFGECRCKPDNIFEWGLIDWKTTCKRNERSFIYEILDRNYDVRIALYRRGIRSTGQDLPVALVAINTSGGCEIRPYELDSDWLDDAEARLFLAVDAMRNFDIEAYCNREPKRIRQPKFSEVNFNEGDDE